MYVEGEEKPPDISAELAKSPKTTIIEENDCFVPHREVSIEYSGPNIKKIVSKIPRIIADSLRVTSTHVYLDDYFLDNTNPAEKVFHIFFHGDKRLDQRTIVWVEFKIKDGVIRPDGSGSLTIEFYPKLITKWEKKTLIQRTPIYDALLKMYTYLFYDEMRRKHLERCKEFAELMMRKTKEILKLMETARYP